MADVQSSSKAELTIMFKTKHIMTKCLLITEESCREGIKLQN